MKFLVVEDGFLNRHHLCNLLSPHGTVDVAIDGHEAVEAVRLALEKNEPYDLVCLDIIMPGMDGNDALKKVREMEAESGYGPGEGMKILMTTASDCRKRVMEAFRDQCDGYLIKPIWEEALLEAIQDAGLTVG
ncbi:MAG: response regulator [Gemmatimonadales bacterium]|nr:response regulator [Gemmatimonadales bacterium]